MKETIRIPFVTLFALVAITVACAVEAQQPPEPTTPTFQTDALWQLRTVSSCDGAPAHYEVFQMCAPASINDDGPEGFGAAAIRRYADSWLAICRASEGKLGQPDEGTPCMNTLAVDPVAAPYYCNITPSTSFAPCTPY